MSSTNSIFLPFVYDNLDEAYIRGVLESAGIGEVERIDFVSKRSPEQNHHAVYVHFKSRGLSQTFLEEGVYCEAVSSPAAVAAVDGFWSEIDKDGCPKIVYSDPWFWKCLKPRAKKHTRGKNDAPRIRIVLDEAPAAEEQKPEALLLGGGEGGTTKGMTRAVSAGGVGSAGPVVGPAYEFCASRAGASSAHPALTARVSAGGVGSAEPVVGPAYEFCAELRTNSRNAVDECDDDDDEYRTQKGDSDGRHGHVPYYGRD